MVHSVLAIVDVLVDNESRGACVLVGPNANLANRAILAEDIVHLLRRDVERQIPDVYSH
jgi:hypothetical protein